MKQKSVKYDEPRMDIILLQSCGDVITWSTQTDPIGGDGTNYDSDDFDSMFG